MTVCIAAISQGAIIGVSDRMLTSGDIQFEPTATPKALSVSNSIALMQAGDAAFNAEIIQVVSRIVVDRINKNPKKWIRVSEVSDLYIKCRGEAKRNRAEASLLNPLGLTYDNYRDEVHKFGEDNAQQLMRDLINFEVPHTAVIVTGIDEGGAHIYVITDGEVSCNDTVGFAAIGSGARHAESQFMLARHSASLPLVDTAVLAYIAKKRSEVAPGVGQATDMFSGGPALGTLASIIPDGIQGFDEIYRQLKEKEEACLDEARKQANEFVSKAPAKAAKQVEGSQELNSQSGGPTIEDKSDVGFAGASNDKKT